MKRKNISTGTTGNPSSGIPGVRVGDTIHVSGTTATGATEKLVGWATLRANRANNCAISNPLCAWRRAPRRRGPHAHVRRQHHRMGEGWPRPWRFFGKIRPPRHVQWAEWFRQRCWWKSKPKLHVTRARRQSARRKTQTGTARRNCRARHAAGLSKLAFRGRAERPVTLVGFRDKNNSQDRRFRLERVCSIFSQLLQFFPRLEFEQALRNRAERHARGFTCWGNSSRCCFVSWGKPFAARDLRRAGGL